MQLTDIFTKNIQLSQGLKELITKCYLLHSAKYLNSYQQEYMLISEFLFHNAYCYFAFF